MVVSNIVALSVSEFFCAQMPSSGVIAAPPCLYVFVQCMCCLLLAVEYFFDSKARARAYGTWHPSWVLCCIAYMINDELVVASLFDPRVEGNLRPIGNSRQTKDKLGIHCKSSRIFLKGRKTIREKRKFVEKSMRLIVPAPPDVGTMRRQATSSSITNPVSLIPTSGATSSSSSSSPVNIVNYRRLYNECTDG